MQQEPSLTFEGALRILGRHELPGIRKLDKILGGVILAAGVGAGVATVGPGVLAPLKMLVAVWGWLEREEGRGDRADAECYRQAVGKASRDTGT